MKIELYDHQLEAYKKLKTGSILCGGVGSGKSITALAYFCCVVCKLPIQINDEEMEITSPTPKDLFIITTARKRDSGEWDRELERCFLNSSSKDREEMRGAFEEINVTVDSWNNIKKYCDVWNSFFIFDEQRVTGSGEWVKFFLRIARHNDWILLSATPGDTWSDYIPVFVANRFYKNRTEFLREHATYARFEKYARIAHWLGVRKLQRNKDKILINMDFERNVEYNIEARLCDYDKSLYKYTLKCRWDSFEGQPIENISKLCFLLRKISNMDPSREEKILEIFKEHSKIIIFYNFDYELSAISNFVAQYEIPFAQWNGHKHEEIPEGSKWIYAVQYSSGAEGWNCIETDTMIFYSLSYSYKTMVQSAGRIDRLNTPFKKLNYYFLISDSAIDRSILKALKEKRTFNEVKFIG